MAEEIAGTLDRRGIEDLARRALLDDRAAVHDDDPVGHAPGKRHLVGDDDHCHALAGELRHHVEHLADGLRVERRGRLVEQHDLGLCRQRTRDRDALLLPTG